VRSFWLAAVSTLAAASVTWAHAFPDHAEPRVGTTLEAPPAEVRVWFDGEIEPVFSTIRVENSDKQRVDKGDARVSPADRRLLVVSVPPLSSGKYRVFWSVVARDGHRTDGDFPFRVK
jgi:methionine-rich copper-binding protein CopC